ncbi:MAG: methyl-accepting chemotaxis protein [Lachnospiraceae bacterium]|nr:methyl-accepting chemotaxis protein [Lachnospiraceae bacterium]
MPIRSESSIRAAAKLLTDVVNQIVNLEYYKNKANQSKYDLINEELKITTKMIDDIQNKTKELQGIASKQNILALNASIEAARAGKAGAGFAVLAEETGNTAKKSAVIYKEITDAVNNISQSMYHLNALYEENK